MHATLVVVRRIIKILVLTVLAVVGGVLGLSKMGIDVLPPPYSAKVHATVENLTEHYHKAREFVSSKLEGGGEGEAEAHHEPHKVVVTTPKVMDVTLTERYVCQIHSQRHIEVRALESGYLENIAVQEGQSVKKGDLMFKVIPILYQAKLDAELAEAQLAQLEFNYTKKLSESKVVAPTEVSLLQAKLAKAQAKAALAKAELNFTDVRAPFDGIVDKQHEQLGSLVNEGDILTTLSDNSVMWVYFNVPEKRYLEYMAEVGQNKTAPEIELELANHTIFTQPGKIGAIEAKFNNETGNISFRGDFPNPEGLLRHGQTGTILIKRPMENAVVIPQRATFENLAKQYVYVVGEDEVVHQRGITVDHELDDIYVLANGVIDPKEKIIVEGTRQVRDGDKVEYEFREPEEILAHAKHKAE